MSGDIQNRTIKFAPNFQGREPGEDLPAARAYLFNSAGHLVHSEPIGKDEYAFPARPGADYRLLIGPDLLKDVKEPPADLLAQLTKANAASLDILAAAKQDFIRFPVSKFIWFCWWQTCIIVHGTVRKLLNPGSSTPKYATICSGTVQIFQVDLGCTLDWLASFQVLTLQSLLVDKLRGKEITAEQIQLFHGPIPPGPLAELRNLRTTSVQLNQSSQRHNTGLSTFLAEKARPAQKEMRVAPVARKQFAQAATLAEHATTIAALDPALFKSYVVINKIILWPFLCQLIPDWWFCWQELGEVPIQSDGSFWAEVCFWCPEDYPDLYFEVIQNYDGVEREISDPQIACSTYYNYDGSQSVDIIVDDPLAVACIPGDGGPDYLYVEVLGITDLDLQLIDGLNTPFTSGTGLVSGFAAQPVPFGGTLGMNMKYHPDMKDYYYRWSYRFDGESKYTQIQAPVVHQYQVLVNPWPITFQKFPDPLGPFTVGSTPNLYKFHDPTKDYVSVDNWNDLFYAFFDSTGGITDPVGYNPYDHDGVSNHKSGMCTLMLEIFDSSGNLVQCNNPHGVLTENDQAGDPLAAGPFSFLLPSGVMYVTAPAANITDHGRLVFRIRVDNNYTVAKLPAVHNTTTGSDANACGFLEFNAASNVISIDYIARHTNNFMNWGLGVYRGLCGTAASTGGNGSSPALPPPPPATFANTAGYLLRALPVTPPPDCSACDDGAAFAVNLNTYAWATNGRYFQTQYNNSATIAFALLKV